MFGGGKTIRESMLQGTRTAAEGAPDLVITNVVVLDHWGVVKCDVGIRTGASSRSARPATPTSPTASIPALEIGPTTEIVAGEGRILTAGGIDCHVHFICPQIVDEAVAAGITTLIGGGTGPAEGTPATTCTPSPRAIGEMLLAMDAMPVNVLLLGKGNTVSTEGLEEQLQAGCGGLKLHEDWGSTPAAIDACLRVADASGVQVAIHTDTLNETGYVRVDARRDRRPHDPRVPHRGRGRRPCAGHHRGRRAAERPALLDEPDAPAHRQHGRRAPRHADGLPPPQPARSRRTSRSPRAASAPRRSPPRTSCTTSARSR